MFSDNPDSTTRFWILSKDPTWDESGDYACLMFTVNDVRGSLKNAVSIVKAFGYNFTDFDCHLNSVSEGERSFFVEVEREGRDVHQLVQTMLASQIKTRLLGIYDTDGPLLVTGDGKSVPDAIAHDHWKKREGLDITDGTTVIYVSSHDDPSLLENILEAVGDINIHDMSRPQRSTDGTDRGFYFVLDKNTSQSQVSVLTDKLDSLGYNHHTLEYREGKLKY